MSVNARITGLKELNDMLIRQLPERVRGNALAAAVVAGARIVQKEAQARVPAKTGTVKRNIKIKRIKTGQRDAKAEYAIGVFRSKSTGKITRPNKRNPSKTVVEYVNDPYYWRFLEFGTSKKAPRAFLRPALETKRSEVVARIAERLKERIIKTRGF